SAQMANDFRVDGLDEQEIGVKVPDAYEPERIGVARAHRDVGPQSRLADLTQNGRAVAIRKFEIEDQTVRLKSMFQEIQRLGHGRRYTHSPAMLRAQASEGVPGRHIVFDDHEESVLLSHPKSLPGVPQVKCLALHMVCRGRFGHVLKSAWVFS